MPKQASIDIKDNGDGTARIVLAGLEFNAAIEDLFNHEDFDPEQVRQNMRLAFLIGGYAHPDSVEYLNGVNKGIAGMEGSNGKLTIKSVTLVNEATQDYRVVFTFTTGPQKGQTWEFIVNLDYLSSDDQDPQVVLRNIKSFTRVAGHGFASRAALNAIKSAKFWF